MRYITTIGEQDFLVEILDERHVSLNGQVYEVDFDSIGEGPVYSMLLEGKSFEAYVYPSEDSWQVLLHGRSYPALVIDEREKRLKAAGGGRVSERAEFQLRAPMPGLVVSIPVDDGQEVEKGDVLIVLESMKMQNELKSPHPGKVSRLRVKVGDSVEQHQIMLSVS